MTEGNRTSLMGTVWMVVDIGLLLQAVKLFSISRMEPVKPAVTTTSQNNLSSLERLVEMNTMPCMVEYSRNSLTVSFMVVWTDDCSHIITQKDGRYKKKSPKYLKPRLVKGHCPRFGYILLLGSNRRPWSKVLK